MTPLTRALASPALVGPVEAPDLHIMTFNVRRRMRWTRAADRWSSRLPLIQMLLAEEQPDLLAAQEVLPDQASALGAALGAGYRRIGHGRRAGPRDEATPLFYRTERLELRSWSQHALSDRPDEPGSMTWGNPIPRVFVEAVFRDRATRAEFLAIGTHLDVFSAPARRRSAAEIAARVAAQTRAALVLGDLNARPDSAPLRTLRETGGLVDGWVVARERLTPEWGTFGDYRAPKDDGRRIDHLLTTPDVDVRSVGIHAEPLRGPWPSDHLPLQAVVRIPRRAAA